MAAKKATVKRTDKMPAKRKTSVKRPAANDMSAFFAALDHPLKAEISATRKIVLGVDKKIAEGVKWNSISFRVNDYFATVNLRSTDKLQLVFHRGAKVKVDGKKMVIDDPKGLIKWLSDDRCLVTLGDSKSMKANMPAFKKIVSAWVKQL